MSEFVERILTVADQQALSKEWYGDANYSEHEVLEAVEVNPCIIKRNGRNFTLLTISKEQGFVVDVNADVMAEAAILKDGEQYDEVFFMDSDEEFIYLEGDDRDFIYQITKSECPKIESASVLSVFNDPVYSPNREMSDYEMDVLL